MVGWYLEFLDGGGKNRELPVGFTTMIYSFKQEYPILCHAIGVATERWREALSGRVVDKMVEYLEDDREILRGSSVAAGRALLDTFNRQEERMERSGGGSGRGGGGGVVVNIDIGKMLDGGVRRGGGGGGRSGVDGGGEVVDAELV